MLYETERTQEPIVEPSLVQMTQKAIELLSVNKNGFVLLVEGLFISCVYKI
jgi:alkaline phosphatase